MQPEAIINLNNLKQNYSYLQSKVGNAKIMAVVKADGYGHGLLPITKYLSKLNIHGFCVALASEAYELVEGKIDNPILHLGKISYNNLDVYYSGQVRSTINSMNDIDILENFGKKNNIIINAHLKIDTGMGRLGVPLNDLETIIKKLSMKKYINIEGVYSHFSTAEEIDKSYRNLQLDNFNKCIKMIKNSLLQVKYFHIANSATILSCPEAYFNMVRPGISLYGVSPFLEVNKNLSPVMSINGTLTLIKNYKKGDYIGYNRLYTLEEDGKIAYVQLGYADGIPVSFTNSRKVEIKNKLFPIVGKVSMDMLSIKCDDEDIYEGEKVFFWGAFSDSLRLENLAKKYNRSPYEFLTGITKRVKKTYIEK